MAIFARKVVGLRCLLGLTTATVVESRVCCAVVDFPGWPPSAMFSTYLLAKEGAGESNVGVPPGPWWTGVREARWVRVIPGGWTPWVPGM